VHKIPTKEASFAQKKLSYPFKHNGIPDALKMEAFVTIAHFTYPSELAVARSFLESQGIHTYVRDELTIQVHNFLSNALGNIRLEVPDSQKMQAIQLLAEHGYENYLLQEDPALVDEEPFRWSDLYGNMPSMIKLWVWIVVALTLISLLIVSGLL